MNIWIHCSNICRSIGGLQRVATELANAMIERGHRVLISHNGSSVPLLPLHPDIMLIPSWRNDIVCIKKFAPDIILPMIYNSSIWDFIVKTHSFDIPWIYTEHNNPHHILYGVIIDNMLVEAPCHFVAGYKERLAVLKIADACHILLPTFKEFIPNMFLDKTYIISNPAQRSKYTAKIYQPNSEGRFRIISAGRLEVKKNQALLIHAFGLIARNFPDWDLHILGDDAGEGEKLVGIIESLQLQNRVFVKPFTKDFEQELLQSHISAIPSLFEGFGLFVVESFAVGLPCVALSSCNGPADIIEDGKSGILVKDHQPETMAQAIKTLIENPEQRNMMGSLGRIRVSSRFDPDIIFQQYEEMFERTIANYAGKRKLSTRTWLYYLRNRWGQLRIRIEQRTNKQ